MADQINGLVSVSKQEIVILLEAGYVLMDMGRWDEAREVFAGAAALLPRSEVPHLALGTLEFAQGRHDKALQEYRKAQSLNPKSALPRAHAGEALLFLGKPAEAARELKAALDLEPDGDGAKLAQALLEAKEAGALPPPKAAGK
jgi:tetratricopeptide (TPR) repeat protein